MSRQMKSRVEWPELPRSQGKQEDAASGQHAPLNAKGRFCSSLRLGCMTAELPWEGQRVSLTGQVGRHRDREPSSIRHLLPRAEESPHPTEHPGNRAGGAGLAVWATEHGGVGV